MGLFRPGLPVTLQRCVRAACVTCVLYMHIMSVCRSEYVCVSMERKGRFMKVIRVGGVTDAIYAGASDLKSVECDP